MQKTDLSKLAAPSVLQQHHSWAKVYYWQCECKPNNNLEIHKDLLSWKAWS